MTNVLRKGLYYGPLHAVLGRIRLRAAYGLPRMLAGVGCAVSALVIDVALGAITRLRCGGYTPDAPRWHGAAWFVLLRQCVAGLYPV